ncbi:extensin family protein [Aliiroseovarius sp.]|uniref:extensin-like domain-containing protein n=1 Tax=Aliiroseovarius sp. TaxID=1872442 RepID=UPI00262D7508|nr:extensin family protein [Aliiroseovarius sp.]
MKSPTALVLTLILGLAVAGQAIAYAPATSPRPIKRPESGTVVPPVVGSVATATEQAPRRSPTPQRRPGSHEVVSAAIDAAVASLSAPMTGSAVTRSPRPKRRPATRSAYMATSAPAPVSAARSTRQSRRGSVCGVREIRGQKIDSIPGRLPGCGIPDAVRVTEVAGVALSQPSVMDCNTAEVLNDWVKTGVKPAVGRLGGGLSSLQVAAHYSCRTRNNQPGAEISEHGKGRAIDISGLVLKNGVSINVLNGWRDPVQGKVLKASHAAACGPFGTVLGPDADRYHQDHLHVDTARYRNGSYCR